MKLNPFKIILWILFLVFVLLNSLRLFIYGFVISFIIVIIDRAFFGTRKRSDHQFLNLFFLFTTFFAALYSFSPFIRSVEFNISHPKWKKLEIVSIQKGNTQHVHSSFHFLEKVYTPLNVHYKNDKGTYEVRSEELKHYALFAFEPLFKQKIVKKELDYIHNRSLNKLIDKKAIHLFQHPSKERMKVFKGNDAFALRHSIGSQIVVLIAYLLFLILTPYSIYHLNRLKQQSKSKEWKDRKTVYIILLILAVSYLIIGVNIVHYLKFI